MCLSASLDLRKPKKGVQNAPKLESEIGTQKCHSALWKCQMAHVGTQLVTTHKIVLGSHVEGPNNTICRE